VDSQPPAAQIRVGALPSVDDYEKIATVGLLKRMGSVELLA
jgi:hypothetical protein